MDIKWILLQWFMVSMITNAFQTFIDESSRKPKEIWRDKGSRFYDRSMKSWMHDNDIEMYPTHNKGKFVAAGKFIRTLKNRIYKYMTSLSKNVYIDKRDDTVNKYSNTYHSIIKMKPVDVKSSTYIDFSKENDNEGPRFEIGDHVRISKHKNIFAKGYTPNWSEKVFLIKKVKNTVLWTHAAISDINGKEIVGMFYNKELQKTNEKNFTVKKATKRKGNKLYVKWKGYDNSFNSCIDKKGIV